MSSSLSIVSPNDGRVIGELPVAGPADVDAALTDLEASLPSLAQIEARAAILSGFSARLLARRDALADIVLREVGKPPVESVGEIEYAVNFIDHAVGLLDSFAFSASAADGQRTDHLPAGVALLMAPFNDPAAGLARKIAPAIAAGCPVLVKPSPLGALTAQAVMDELNAAAADVAAGAARMFLSDDPGLIGRAIDARQTAIVSFTGSTTTGRLVAARAGAALKSAVLELGGNCPCVILPDADLDLVVRDVVERKRKAAGQACSAINRVLVHRDIHDAFLDRLVEAARAVPTGPADGAGVVMGPVRTASSVMRLAGLKERASACGERVVLDGCANADGPYLFPLTILAAEEGARSVLDNAEAFGPLLTVRSYADSRSAIAAALAERHALAAYIYGRDASLLKLFAQSARFGSVGVNTTRIQGADVPTGGFGEAGYGREGGQWGLGEFLATRNLRAVPAKLALS